MNDLFAAAVEVEQVIRRAGFRFCFIGGLAVQRWGQPRMTADLDLTVMTGFGGEEPYVDALLGALPARIGEAREFALRNRVLLLATTKGIHIDIALGAMPFEERAVARASPFVLFDDQAVTTCSAEDLVVHKAFAGRDKDWLDIAGIAKRQAALDHELIFEELGPLLELKDDTTTEPRLRQLLARG